MPFVQGQLRNTPLSVNIKTECAHCNQSMHIDIDSDLKYRVEEEGANPIIFIPIVDFSKLNTPSIIDSF